MTRRLPPLSSLRVFEAVARLGSVTRAAEELGRTHGAVSRQLRTVHDFAGIAFFEKQGTGIRLNRHGEALREVVAAALGQLGQGWRRVLDEASGETLHVACSATFAMRWLVPRLAGFYRSHPDLRLRLSMTSARDIRHQGADLVIAWDRTSFPAADAGTAIPLAPVRFGPVCAPGYPVSREDGVFSFETRIAHEFTSRAWSQWQGDRGIAVRWRGEKSFPHTHLCIEAALGGLGVALAEQRMVGEEVAAGRLLAPFGFTPFPDTLAVVPAGPRAGTAAAGAFVAWLADTLRPDHGSGDG